MSVTIVCDFCDEGFEVKDSRSDSARFCSRDCMGSWRSENMTGDSHPNWSRTNVECDNCGDTFDKLDKRIERSENDFCSDSCRKGWWSDKIREYAPEGEDHQNWRGGVEDVSCSWCGEIVEVYPDRQDNENVFCDQSCYGCWLSENNVGENHPRWNGGGEQRIYEGSWTTVSNEVRSEYPNCQNCGIDNNEHQNVYGFGLHVHHIEPYASFDDAERANRKENLVPLCVQCHHNAESEELSVISPYRET